MHTTDVLLAPEERLREVAAGLVRLRTRPQLAAAAGTSSEYAAAKESVQTARKALGLPAPPRPDPHAG